MESVLVQKTSTLKRLHRIHRRAALTTLFLSHLGFVAMLFLIIYQGFSWINLGLLIFMFTLTELGLTVGYHRYFTHRGFQTNAFIKRMLGIWGAMAAQGPISFWVAHHRAHHRFSDKPEDPHSPKKTLKPRQMGLSKFFHSHMGWLVESTLKERKRYTRDLRADSIVHQVDTHYLRWVALGLLLPGLLGLSLHQHWFGFVEGFVFGGIGRMFLVHHSTWCVNSICHLFGTKPYVTTDNSRNNLVVALLTMGEGWHNNHHAFPRSARHGLRWWQVDVSYYFICLLRVFGLVWDVRLPSQAQLAAQASGQGYSQDVTETQLKQ